MTKFLGPFQINKGWISDSDFYNCPEGGALTFTSFQPWANGSIKTIDGYNAFSNFQLSAKTSILGFTSWQDPAQIGIKTPVLVASSGGKIYSTLLSSISLTDITGATSPATTGIYTFDSLNGKLLLFNSGSSFTNVPLKLSTYNGNVANLGGTPPNANIVKVVNNFAFAGQVLAAASTASTVYWSNVNDPETWNAASNITFRNNDGDFITALGAIGSNLIIFKQRSIGSLSTTTLTTSGTVTLGPLTQITDRVGCCGSTCVDQMQDGTLVFLGMDRHLYQTDGASIVDLANLPSPSSNYSYGVNFAQSNPPVIGLFASPASVKVDGLFGRIFVHMPNFSGTGSTIYMYDYLHKAWCDWSELANDLSTGTGSGNITCFASMPNQLSNNFALAYSAWMGTSTGYFQTFSPTTQINHMSGSSTWPCVFETSLVLGGRNPPDFIPRCLLIPFRQVGGTNIAAQVEIGWDGTYQSAVVVTMNSAVGRVSFPIKETPRSLGVHPITLQVRITVTANISGAQTIIEPLYIADEVIQ